LLYCLRQARVDVADLRTDVEGSLVRNERGRLRIGDIRVHLAPRVPPEQRERLERCRALFEDFRTVTDSVREGVTVDVKMNEPLAVVGTEGKEDAWKAE
jgi:hypothetical protein